jgi:hypothetical protein
MTFEDLMQPRYPDDREAGPVIGWVIATPTSITKSIGRRFRLSRIHSSSAQNALQYGEQENFGDDNHSALANN